MTTATYLRFILISLLLLQAACTRKLDLPASGQQKIVLLGELTADDSIYIRAGQSTVIKSGSSLNEELIQGLDISVEDGSGNLWHLNSEEDDFAASVFTLPFHSSHVVNAGMHYRVTAAHQALGIAETSVTIPKAFNATVTDTASVTYNGEACLRLQISIADNPEENFYAIEVLHQSFTIEPAFFYDGKWLKQSSNSELYDSLVNAGETPPEKTDTFAMRLFNRVPVYTSDAQSEHLLNGNIATLANRVLLKDHSFNGSNHQTDIYIPKTVLGGHFPGIGQRTLVQVKSITGDYFRYLQGYEQYDLFSGSTNTTAPVRITGNISNGVGMIGGVHKKEFGYLF